MLCQELGLLLAESMTPMIRAVGVMLRRLRQEMTVAPARNRELLERQFQFWSELEEALDRWHRSFAKSKPNSPTITATTPKSSDTIIEALDMANQLDPGIEETLRQGAPRRRTK
ncbi:hypothetical protein TWF132_011061 [Orbilia oligospora]|nr:hypothetical protein TWF132_011061 [Orbilia oligospora]